jgi:uncharacterized membrane protein
MVKLLGILIFVAALGIVLAAFFGMVHFNAKVELTPKGHQTIQQGTNAARSVAADALDGLKNRVK